MAERVGGWTSGLVAVGAVVVLVAATPAAATTTGRGGGLGSKAAVRELHGVTTVSATDAWAVGRRNNGSGDKTLIEHGNGKKWTAVHSPSPGSKFSFLDGVSADTATDAWAVGEYDATSTKYLTLVEHWDGTRWTTTRSSSPGSADNALNGVTTLSASNAWAVGMAGDGVADEALVEHWNGSRWAAVASPKAGTTSELYGVSADSVTDAWAVGDFNGDAGQGLETLVEHWDGTAWTKVPSPNPAGSFSNTLLGVDALSASDVWAVGEYNPPSGGELSLIEHWDGTSWTLVPHPDPDPDFDLLASVAGVSASDVWVVGDDGQAPSQKTLIEHWDGTAWSKVPSPDPGATGSTLLAGVSAGSATKALAVGYYYNGAVGSTLVDRWDGDSWTRLP